MLSFLAISDTHFCACDLVRYIFFYKTRVCLYAGLSVCFFFFVSSIVQKLSSFDFDTKTKIVHTLSCLITIFELVRQWWASFNTLLYCQVLEGLLGFLQASNISNHFFCQGTFLLHFFFTKNVHWNMFVLSLCNLNSSGRFEIM